MPIRPSLIIAAGLALAAVAAVAALAAEKAAPAGWPYFSAHNRAPAPGGLKLVGDLRDWRKAFETTKLHAGVGKALYGQERALGQAMGIDVLPGGTSSPIVADGAVFISYYRPSGDVRLAGTETTFRTLSTREGWNPDIWCIAADDCLVAIDATTGEKRFLAEHKGKGLNRVTIKRNDWGPAPCFADGKVFFVGTTARVYAHDAKDGRTLWEAETPAHAALAEAKAEALQKKQWGPKSGLHTGCIVADGVLVVPTCTGGGLMGLAVADGKPLWTLQDRRTSYQSDLATPRIWRHGGREYVLAVSSSGDITLIDPKDGRVLWAQGGNGSNLGTIALDGDIAILNVKDQPDVKGAGLWGAYRLSLEGAKKLWSLPDEEKYWHEWKVDKGPRPKYAVRDGLAWLAVGGAFKEHPRYLLAVDAETGRIRSETPMDQKEILPEWVEDKLIVWADTSHGNPLKVSYWTADPDGPQRLTDVIEVPVAAITGYLVPMETPYVDGRLYMRTMGGAAGFDLRRE